MTKEGASLSEKLRIIEENEKYAHGELDKKHAEIEKNYREMRAETIKAYMESRRRQGKSLVYNNFIRSIFAPFLPDPAREYMKEHNIVVPIMVDGIETPFEAIGKRMEENGEIPLKTEDGKSMGVARNFKLTEKTDGSHSWEADIEINFEGIGLLAKQRVKCEGGGRPKEKTAHAKPSRHGSPAFEAKGTPSPAYTRQPLKPDMTNEELIQGIRDSMKKQQEGGSFISWDAGTGGWTSVSPIIRQPGVHFNVWLPVTGKLIDIRYLPAEEIDIRDIATTLAYQNRYGGSRGADSQAYFSLRCCRWMKHRDASPGKQLAALLYQAHKAYTGDLPRWIGRPKFVEDLRSNITKVIFEKYGVPKAWLIDANIARCRVLEAERLPAPPPPRTDQLSVIRAYLAEFEALKNLLDQGQAGG